ncbi:MAG: nuclear transport factor 2 family protein, partial [Aquisalimonadaceae bacterium]
MPAISFETPADAAAAFYRAFALRDVEAMMAVWSEAGDIACIHPLAHRIKGPQAIRRSWQQIFHNAPPLRFLNSDEQLTLASELAVQTLHEVILLEGEDNPQSALIATNIFRRETQGWRLILHHAAPLPDDRE